MFMWATGTNDVSKQLKQHVSRYKYAAKPSTNARNPTTAVF